MSWELLLANAGWVFALMSALWLVSVPLKDVSIVDPWWSMAFLLVTAHTALRSGLTVPKVVLLAEVCLWALRLWLHLLLRARGKPEDPRYAAFRQRFGPERYWWVSYFQVFLLQGGLVLLVSAPLQLAASAGPEDAWRLNDLAGLVVFWVGLGVESAADWQLRVFRAAPGNRGRILDTGLWRYSRHPNYFGEALVWWGFGLSALDRPWGWAALAGPALMTFLLVRVSGVSLLDQHLLRTRPGYADYVRRTSAFVPMPRRNGG